MSDDIRPNYYKRGGLEAREVIERWELNFNEGSIVKYLCRAGVKVTEGATGLNAALKDLTKARTYANFEIERIEKLIKEKAEQDEKNRKGSKQSIFVDGVSFPRPPFA